MNFMVPFPPLEPDRVQVQLAPTASKAIENTGRVAAEDYRDAPMTPNDPPKTTTVYTDRAGSSTDAPSPLHGDS
jgi:hypothetical protein